MLKKLLKKIKLIKEISTDEKVAQKLNSGELSLDELATAIDEDIAEFEKANSKKQQFKDWFNDGDNIGYNNDNELYNGYKRWLNTWKKGLTVYNPGWHLQNFLQNKGQNYLGLGTDAFGSQKEARQHLKNIKGQANKANDIISKKGRVYTPEEISDLAKRYGVIDGWSDIETQSRGIFPKLESKIDNSRLMKLNLNVVLLQNKQVNLLISIYLIILNVINWIELCQILLTHSGRSIKIMQECLLKLCMKIQVVLQIY